MFLGGHFGFFPCNGKGLHLTIGDLQYVIVHGITYHKNITL